VRRPSAIPAPRQRSSRWLDRWRGDGAPDAGGPPSEADAAGPALPGRIRVSGPEERSADRVREPTALDSSAIIEDDDSTGRLRPAARPVAGDAGAPPGPAREIRRFTQRSRRRRIAWIVGAALTVLVVGGSVGAAYSPLFAVQTITVEGASASSPPRCRRRSPISSGARSRSWIQRGQGRARAVPDRDLPARGAPPHDLVVRIVERTPSGSSSRATGASRSSMPPVSSSRPPRPAGYALIDVAGGGTGLRGGGHRAAHAPRRAARRSARHGVHAGRHRAHADRRRHGGLGRRAVGAEDAALQADEGAPGASYDVSSPGVGVVG
jgi:cell division protein FtsQ